MRRILMGLLAVGALGVAAGAYAQGAPSTGLSGGNAPGAGAWGNTTSRGNANNRDIGTFENDPTGLSGTEYRISGNQYGETRGPGANPIQPEKGISNGQPANISGGHVPTEQELARGAPPAMVDPGPIPRPQLGGRGAGM